MSRRIHPIKLERNRTSVHVWFILWACLVPFQLFAYIFLQLFDLVFGVQIQTIPLSKQVEYYSKVYQDLVRQLGSAKAQHHLSNSLFIFVVGSNDLLGYVESGSDLPMKTTPQHYVDSMLMTLKQELKVMQSIWVLSFLFFEKV